MKLLAVLLAAAAALGFAGSAHAAPQQCSDIGPNTRLCARPPGHTAIISSPDPAFTNPGAGWGFGTLGFPVFAPGGGGIRAGF